MKEGTIEVTAIEANARKLMTLMDKNNIKALELPDLTLDQVKEFISGKRQNLATISINDEDLLEIVCNKKTAILFKDLMLDMKIEQFEFQPVNAIGLWAFINKERDNILQLDIEQHPKEENAT